jgi:hypothetical protein
MTSAACFPTSKWMRGVADDHTIHHLRRFVLMRLMLFRNRETGRCDPSHKTVYEALDVDRATVCRAISDAVRRGWLAPTTSRGRVTNQYVFTFPPGTSAQQSQQCDCSEPSTVAPERPLPRATVAPVHTNRRTRAHQPSHPCDPNRSLNEIRERGKSQTHGSPPGASRVTKKTDAGSDEAFAKFWAAYPKRVSKGHARKAWDAAIKRGVDPETMIAAAQSYAVQRQDEEPRYTKHPATWINGACWDDEPSGKPVLNEHGDVVAYVEQPRRNGPLTWDEVIEQVARGGDDE